MISISSVAEGRARVAKTTHNLFLYAASICLVCSLVLLVFSNQTQAQEFEEPSQLEQYEGEVPFNDYVPPGECDPSLGGCPTMTDTGCYLYPNGEQICPSTEDLADDAANDSQTASEALNEDTSLNQPAPIEEPAPLPEPVGPSAEPDVSPELVEPTPAEPEPIPLEPESEPSVSEPSVSEPIVPASENPKESNPEPVTIEKDDKNSTGNTEDRKPAKQGEPTREETKGSTNGTRLDSASSVDEPKSEGLAGMILMGGGFALVLALGAAGHVFTRFR